MARSLTLFLGLTFCLVNPLDAVVGNGEESGVCAWDVQYVHGSFGLKCTKRKDLRSVGAADLKFAAYDFTLHEQSKMTISLTFC